MAEIINTADLANASLDQSRMLSVYCGLDCCVTLEIFNVLKPQMEANDNAKVIYDFERALRAPVMDMQLRGLLVDKNERARVINDYEGRLIHLKDYLNEIIDALLGWNKDPKGWRLNPASPQKLKYLYYGIFQLKEQKTYSKGESKVSVNKEALEKFAEEEAFPIDYISRCLLALRKVTKTIGALKAGVEKDGRMRFSYSITGTITGRFSSSKNVYNRGCLRPTAEILTQEGWKALGDFSAGEEIMQYCPDTKKLTFASAEKNIYDFSGDLTGWSGEQGYLAVTPEHKVLFDRPNSKHYFVRPAEEIEFGAQISIPIAGVYEGGEFDLTEWEARLLAAHLADGSSSRRGFRLSAMKVRKHERLLMLLKKTGWEWSEQADKPTYRRFYVRMPEHLRYLQDKESLVTKLKHLSHPAAVAFLDEQQYWDGTRRGKSTVIPSSRKHWAEAIQTLASTHGIGATIVAGRNNRGYGANNTDAMIYKVNLKPRVHSLIRRRNWQHTPYIGKVMCPTVPTGFFLVRENGFISVTGNSNAQNISNALRRIFVADEGKKFAYCDLAGAEARIVAYRAEDLNYIEANEGALKVHTYVAKMIWPDEPWPTNPHEATEYAETTKFAGSSMYKSSKVGQHLSNYWGAPTVMAKSLGVSVPIAAKFQNTYYDRFPGIREWHAEVARILQTEGVITTALGRRRKFFKRKGDHSTIREAIAYEPQSTIGDLLNLGMYRVWAAYHPIHFPVRLFSQLHDAILVDYDTPREDELLPQILKLMTIPIKVKGRNVIIPVDAKVGWNWEEVKAADMERNPDGLIGWKEGTPDPRTRHFPAKIDPWDLTL